MANELAQLCFVNIRDLAQQQERYRSRPNDVLQETVNGFISEAQKALAYLRKVRDGRQFFRYLQGIKQNGRAVIRSGQTLRYYDELLAACERHLRPLQHKPEEMLHTLAWAIRLLRYYRAVPEAAQQLAAERRLAPARVEQPAARAEAASPVPPAKAAPTLPAVGDTFAGNVIARDEEAVLIAIPGFGEEKAIGVMKAEAIEGGRTERYRVGNVARVEVTGVRTLKSGRTIVELRPATKKDR
jgi:hypothetical protein